MAYVLSTTHPLPIHFPQPRKAMDVWRVSQSTPLIGPAIIAGQKSSYAARSIDCTYYLILFYGVLYCTVLYIDYHMRIFCVRISQKARFLSCPVFIGTLLSPSCISVLVCAYVRYHTLSRTYQAK